MKKILIVTMFVLFAVINVTVIADRNEASNISLSSLFNMAHADLDSEIQDYLDNYAWGDEREVSKECGEVNINGRLITIYERWCEDGKDECESQDCYLDSYL